MDLIARDLLIAKATIKLNQSIQENPGSKHIAMDEKGDVTVYNYPKEVIDSKNLIDSEELTEKQYLKRYCRAEKWTIGESGVAIRSIDYSIAYTSDWNIGMKKYLGHIVVHYNPNNFSRVNPSHGYYKVKILDTNPIIKRYHTEVKNIEIIGQTNH